MIDELEESEVMPLRIHPHAVPWLRIIDYLHQRGTASRTQIARHLGISKASVTEMVRRLQREGLVREVSGARTGHVGRGRRAVPVQVNPQSGLFVGIDQAGESLVIVVIDMALNTYARFEFPQFPRSAPAPQERIYQIVDGVITGLGSDRALLRGIGVAIPGLVGDDGTVAYSAPYQWRDFSLRAAFEARYRLPTTVHNDVNAMLVSEVVGTSLVDASVMLVYIGEGIGGASWFNRQLWIGSHAASGEWGHVTIRVNGKACQCGKRGCLEAEFALPHLIARLADRGVWLGSSRELVSHANEGEVTDELATLATAVAQGLAGGLAFVDPDCVIVTGPLTKIPFFMEHVSQAIRDSWLPHAMEHVVIRQGSLAADGAAVGAAYLAVDHYLTSQVAFRSIKRTKEVVSR